MNQMHVLVLLALPSTVLGQDTKKINPALVPIKDDPALPRVLLIGDSISIGYTVPTRTRLEGKANVHRIPTNGGPTTNGVKKVMVENGVAVNDLYAFALERLKEIQRPGNVHFTDAGSEALARRVAAAIEKQLRTRR